MYDRLKQGDDGSLDILKELPTDEQTQRTSTSENQQQSSLLEYDYWMVLTAEYGTEMWAPMERINDAIEYYEETDYPSPFSVIAQYDWPEDEIVQVGREMPVNQPIKMSVIESETLLAATPAECPQMGDTLIGSYTAGDIPDSNRRYGSWIRGIDTTGYFDIHIPLDEVELQAGNHTIGLTGGDSMIERSDSHSANAGGTDLWVNHIIRTDKPDFAEPGESLTSQPIDDVREF
jgi:hypothetical protein